MNSGTKSEVRRPRGAACGYRDVRHRIETGDVLLFQGTSAISRFIRWGSKSPYSHAGIALWCTDRLLVIQSAHRGVELLPASTAVEKYDGQVDWYKPREAVRQKAHTKTLINAAFDELGKPYAVMPLVALVVRMFRGEEWGNPDSPEPSENYFCSQLISRCYRRAGVDLVPRKADQDTSPGDLVTSGALELFGVLHQHPQGVSPLSKESATAAAKENAKVQAA